MNCKSFKNTPGKRGKPAKDASCSICGVIWRSHYPRGKTTEAEVSGDSPESSPTTPTSSLDVVPSEPFRTEAGYKKVRRRNESLMAKHFGKDHMTIDDWN